MLAVADASPGFTAASALFLAPDESVLPRARRRSCSPPRCWSRRWLMLSLYQGGRSVVDSDSVEWRAENLSPRQVGTPAQQAVLENIQDYFLIFYLGLLGVVLLARGARTIAERRGGMINLSYGTGRGDRVPKRPQRAGSEPALQYPACQRLRRPRALLHLPHSRDRRLSLLPEPSQREAFVLDRVGAATPIRLACQLRPETDLSFFQLFMPHAVAANASQPHHASARSALSGQRVHRHVLWGSTKLAKQLPGLTPSPVVNQPRRGMLERRSKCGGQAEPVRRRRTIGAVRARRRPADRLPPGAPCGGHDISQCRRVESVPEPRSARADPLRHRHSWQRRSFIGDRLCATTWCSPRSATPSMSAASSRT